MTPTELFDLLRAHPVVRRLAWIGFVCLVAAVTLTGYVFGLTEGFFGRAFSATLVLWLLAVGTLFGIAPLLAWLTTRLAGRAAPPRSRRSAPSARPPHHRMPTNRWR